MYIEETNLIKYYTELSRYHDKYLKEYGVKFPRLKNNENYTKDALVLIYLYVNFQKPVSKDELTDFLSLYGDRPNDVQQARHLGQQKGWYIITGTRHDSQCGEFNVKPGQYSLISIKEPYPNFSYLKRNDNLRKEDWDEIKKRFNYKCATCGSIEGESNFHYPNIKTELQKGHKDPNKELTWDNIIPQCEQCNRQDRNNFVYNDKGRVIKIANPEFVLRSDKKIKNEMLKLLKNDLS